MNNFKNKKILVTGGSGFIGSHLCHRLVEAGAELYVTVKYNSIVDNVRLAGYWDDIRVLESDLRNPDSLAPLRKIKPEIVFHLAAYNHVSDSFGQYSEAMDSNSRGTVNLMEAYEDYERFIYVSTSEVYGFQESVPFHEGQIPHPLSPYAIGKFSGELYARMKYKSLQRPVVVLRPFNAYGPYQSPRAVIAELILKCLRGETIRTTRGVQTREFNFVENHVDGFLAAATVEKAVGEVINLGNGEEVRIVDLVHRIHTLTASKSELKIGELPDRDGEIWRMCTANQKARDLLGWSPRVELEEGLERTIAWFRSFVEVFSGKSAPLGKLSLY